MTIFQRYLQPYRSAPNIHCTKSPDTGINLDLQMAVKAVSNSLEPNEFAPM